MEKFFKDIFTDGAGKYSSKRTMGITAGIIGLSMGILGGFHFYNIDNPVIQTVLTFSGALLGISVFTKEA